MENEREVYREKIIEMIRGIDDLWILNQIHKMIIHIIKED